MAEQSESLESNSNELEQNSRYPETPSSLQSNWGISDVAANYGFSLSTPHSLSEFRNSGINNPVPMTGSIGLGNIQPSVRAPTTKYLDCRQNNSNPNAPDPLAGIFESTSIVGADIHYNTSGVSHQSSSQYLDFAGQNSFAIATNASTTISNSSFTMEVWIRPDNFSSGNFNIQAVMWRGGTSLNGDISTINTGKVRFRWTGADNGLQSSTTLSTSTWYHVVGVYHVYNYVGSNNAANSGITAIFINGSLDSSTSLSGSRVIDRSGTTSLMSFGFYNSQNKTSLNPLANPTYQFSFDGRIGQTRFYDGALSPAKILQNYNASKGTYGYGSNSGSIVS